MATTDEGKIDIGKLQLKLFAGPNGINVLDLVPGKAPPLRPKSPIPQPNETILTVTESARPALPTIQLDIDLNDEDGENKSDDEKLDEDNVLSSLCKKRPKKPNVRPPSRTFVKRLGSSSSSEEVTLLIDTKTNLPHVNVVDKNENNSEINITTKANQLAIPSHDHQLSPSSNGIQLSPSSNGIQLSPSSNGIELTLPTPPKDQVNTFPPVKFKHEDSDKQLNITLITKALQERNAKKKESDTLTHEHVESFNNKVNHLSVVDKPSDTVKETKGLDRNTLSTGRKLPPPVSPKPSGRKKFNIVTDEDKPLKPSDIAKEQRIVKKTREDVTKPVATKEDIKKALHTREETIKTKFGGSKDQSITKTTIEQINRKNIEQSVNEILSANRAEVGKPVFLEINDDKILGDRNVKDISDTNTTKEDVTLRLRSNTHSLKRPETNEPTYNRTYSEGSKIPKTTPKVDRSQSEVPKSRKEPTKPPPSEKDELSNKTYLELETLKNISQKANEKSQVNDKLTDSRKLPTPRNFGSIENISVKRYQRIETSDYFNYKKSNDDIRAKENDMTDNEKNQTSDLFKSKVDGHKEGRIRERSNTTEAKSNVKYVPYSSGKITNSPDTLTPSTYNRSLSANDASMLPRFKGTSGPTSSVVTKSSMVKPCPSFPSRVLDRFMPKNNSTIETKRSNTTYT